MTPGRALIVEDDPEMATLLAGALRTVSLESVSAADESAALSRYRDGPFDLVVTDYNLTRGNGRGVVHGIRALDPDVPILLMSGNIGKRELSEVIGESIDEYVDKPLEIPALLGAVERLVGLGRERRRARHSGTALLQLTSKVRLGAPAAELLPILVRCATEVSPFQRAAIYLERPGSDLLHAEAVCGALSPDAFPDVRRDRMEALYRGGVKRGAAVVVSLDQPGHGAEAEAPDRWWPDQRVLVELRSRQRFWGYLCLEAPRDDRTRPDEIVPTAALLAGYIANEMENKHVYELEARRRYQLETIGQLVEVSLRSPAVDVTMATLAEAAVRRFGAAFACFLERTPDGAGFAIRHPVFRFAKFAESGAPLVRQASERVARVAESRQPLALRSSLVGNPAHHCSLAIPIYTGQVLRHVFLIEDDARPEFDADDVLAFRTMTDQIGLIWSRLLYQRYLESAKVELERSYRQLQEAHQKNVRLRDIVKRFVPSSTWAFAERTSEDASESEGRVVDLVVMFVDISGFTPLAERAPASEILRLLNTYLTLVSGIVVQHRGEVIKYIGDGVMASFADRHDALRAADDVLRSQQRLNAELAGTSLGTVRLKVGMAYGRLLEGNVGPFYHQDRTLLGDTVNTAARLEKRAEPGTALVDASAVPDGGDLRALRLAEIPSLVLKGKSRPVPVVTFARDEAVYRPARPDLEATSPGGEEILVVDDDPDMLDFLSACLGAAGHHVRTARGARDALAQLEAARPALIICDVQMPEMNGFDLCRQVRARGAADVPFIFCSILSGVPQRVAGLQLGADDYMVKPVDPAELLVRVEAQLQRGRLLRRLLREVGQNREGVILAGAIAEVGVPQILQTVEGLGTKGLRVRLELPDGRAGEVYLVGSDVVHAESGGGGERRLVGEKAFLRMLGWSDGRFVVEHRLCPGEPTVSASVPRLLLEGLARLDEERLLRGTLAAAGETLAVASGVDLFTHRFDAKTLQVLCVLDKNPRLADILDASPLGDLETLRILSSLVHSGLLVAGKG